MAIQQGCRRGCRLNKGWRLEKARASYLSTGILKTLLQAVREQGFVLYDEYELPKKRVVLHQETA